MPVFKVETRRNKSKLRGFWIKCVSDETDDNWELMNYTKWARESPDLASA